MHEEHGPKAHQQVSKPDLVSTLGSHMLGGHGNQAQGVHPTNIRESVPVVKVWSVRGVEYAIMSFMLWAIAIALTWVIVSIINGQTGFVNLSGALSLAIVSLPIFSFFFLRLKKAELLNPELRLESTKRRFSQLTQIVSFAVSFFASLALVSGLIAAIGGESDNLGKNVGTALVFIVIWGALFAYYWNDEHRQAK